VSAATAFAAFWSALSPARLIAYVLVGGVLVACGFAAIAWYSSASLGGLGAILHRPVPKPPQVLTQVKWLTKTKTVTVEGPVKVEQLTAPEAAKIQKEFAGNGEAPGPTDRFLGLWHVASAPGDAMVTLLADGTPKFTYAEDPEPFFGWGGPWLVGGGPTYGNGGIGGTILAGKEIVRTGKITWQADVRGSYLGTQGWDGRVELLAIVKIQR
jgi:hypothetical protein